MFIQLGNINTVEAKIKKGVNIIKYKNSSSSVPTHKDEIAALIEQRDKAKTESELTLINEQLQELEDEMVAWFKSREYVEKEEEILKKLDLLLDAIDKERSTKEGKKKTKENTSIYRFRLRLYQSFS